MANDFIWKYLHSKIYRERQNTVNSLRAVLGNFLCCPVLQPVATCGYRVFEMWLV